MKENKAVHVHHFDFSSKKNKGESLTLRTEYFDNGDKEYGLDKAIYTTQELTLWSYCNSASFKLGGINLTPKLLRDLANELESSMIEAKNKL